MTKRCTKCELELPLSAFTRKKGGRLGLNSRCRACMAVANAAWHAANRERRRAYDQARYNRTAATAGRRRYREANRARVNSTHAAWQRANAAKKLAWNRRWREANREKAALANHRSRAMRAAASGECTVEQLCARIAFYGDRCWICRGPWEEIDHVKPIARGGSNWPANLRPICEGCNRRKSNLWQSAARLSEVTSQVLARQLSTC